MAKKKTAKSSALAKIKNVQIWKGPPSECIKSANAAIAAQGRRKEARPVEFCKVDEFTLAIVINYRQLSAPQNVRTVTGVPENEKENWNFIASGNHPALSFNGVVWLFGVI